MGVLTIGVVTLAASPVLLMLCRAYGFWPGPGAEQAFERAFGEAPSDGVIDLQFKYTMHLKGNAVYLSFTVAPDQLGRFVDIDRGISLILDDSDDISYWRAADVFQDLSPFSLEDVRSAVIYHESTKGMIKEYVAIPSTGQVYYHRLIDSDIRGPSKS